MKKTMIFIGVILVSMMLFGCRPNYSDKAGVYELYEISGDFTLSNFEYYTIELFEDQKAIVLQKRTEAGSEPYQAESSYVINGNQITFTTKIGFTNVKEVHYYNDGEIHMVNTDATDDDLEYVAKFRRAE